LCIGRSYLLKHPIRWPTIVFLACLLTTCRPLEKKNASEATDTHSENPNDSVSETPPPTDSTAATESDTGTSTVPVSDTDTDSDSLMSSDKDRTSDTATDTDSQSDIGFHGDTDTPSETSADFDSIPDSNTGSDTDARGTPDTETHSATDSSSDSGDGSDRDSDSGNQDSEGDDGSNDSGGMNIPDTDIIDTEVLNVSFQYQDGDVWTPINAPFRWVRECVPRWGSESCDVFWVSGSLPDVDGMKLSILSHVGTLDEFGWYLHNTGVTGWYVCDVQMVIDSDEDNIEYYCKDTKSFSNTFLSGDTVHLVYRIGDSQKERKYTFGIGTDTDTVADSDLGILIDTDAEEIVDTNVKEEFFLHQNSTTWTTLNPPYRWIGTCPLQDNTIACNVYRISHAIFDVDGIQHFFRSHIGELDEIRWYIRADGRTEWDLCQNEEIVFSEGDEVVYSCKDTANWRDNALFGSVIRLVYRIGDTRRERIYTFGNGN
jgi:hypothetical protein